MNDVLPAVRCAELVVPGQGVGVAGPLVAEQLAAARQVTQRARAGFDEDVLVVVADLVAEVAQHRAVRLAESHPQRLAVGVKGFHQVDGDHPVGVPDRDPLAGAVTGQQVEGQAAVALASTGRPADRGRRAGRPAGAAPAVAGSSFSRAIVSSGSGSRRISEWARHRPRAETPEDSDASQLQASGPDCVHRIHRAPSTIAAPSVSATIDRLGRCRPTGGAARLTRAALERERSCGTPDRRRRAWALSLHGRQYRKDDLTHAVAACQACVAASDRGRRRGRSRTVRGRLGAGLARLPDALAPVPDHPAGQQPAAPGDPDRRTRRTGPRADPRHRRAARRVRPRPVPLRARSNRCAPNGPRSGRGWPRAGCPAASTRTSSAAGSARRWPTSSPPPGTTTPWPCSAMAG